MAASVLVLLAAALAAAGCATSGARRSADVDPGIAQWLGFALPLDAADWGIVRRLLFCDAVVCCRVVTIEEHDGATTATATVLFVPGVHERDGGTTGGAHDVRSRDTIRFLVPPGPGAALLRSAGRGECFVGLLRNAPTADDSVPWTVVTQDFYVPATQEHGRCALVFPDHGWLGGCCGSTVDGDALLDQSVARVAVVERLVDEVVAGTSSVQHATDALDAVLDAAAAPRTVVAGILWALAHRGEGWEQPRHVVIDGYNANVTSVFEWLRHYVTIHLSLYAGLEMSALGAGELHVRQRTLVAVATDYLRGGGIVWR